MGQSVRQTFRDDGRPHESDNPAIQEKNEGIYFATQHDQAVKLKKNNERWKRNKARLLGCTPGLVDLRHQLVN